MSEKDFQCVVIGASAGGVESLKLLFSGLQKNLGSPFVVALHISPNHTSAMTEILSRKTEMPVVNLEEGTQLLADTVYVVPPGKDALIRAGGVVHLEGNISTHGPRPNINRLFSSASDVYGHNLIGVILSGSGSDGSQGASKIKLGGGLVLAQHPVSTNYPSMPNAAINLGCVDYFDSPTGLASELTNLLDETNLATELDQRFSQLSLQPVLDYLYFAKGFDFSDYKKSTISRRIANHMRSLKVSSIADYLVLLRTSQEELDRLAKSMFISVTSFFREAEAFEHLGNQIAKQKPQTSFRAWVAGCATGQEAYSLAMLLKSRLPESCKIQIFATDVSADAINTARKGIYPSDFKESIPQRYLEKYVISRESSIQMSPSLRECILFSNHNILKDPPFLSLDLVSCRNLLIYLSQEAQNTVMSLFNYSLKDQGTLFLGRSESTGDRQKMFVSDGSSHKVFKSHRVVTYPSSIPLGGMTPRSIEKKRQRPMRPGSDHGSHILEKELSRVYAPPSVLIDNDFKVLEVYGNLEGLIEIQSGFVDTTIEKLFSKDLKIAIKGAIRHIQSLDSSEEHHGEDASKIPFQSFLRKRDGSQIRVRFRVWQTTNRAQEILYGISFLENKPLDADDAEFVISTEASNNREEMEDLRAQLRGSVEDLENSNEELQAINEELQSTNEELQSSNEELETSNEELQSTNEELVTVNDELRLKTDELSQALGLKAALLDSFHGAVAFLNNEGVITEVNRQWLDFGQANGISNSYSCIGVNYLDVCERGARSGLPESSTVKTKIIDLLRGEIDRFEVKYPCHSESEDRWFLVVGTPVRTEIDGPVEGAFICHMNLMTDVKSVGPDETKAKEKKAIKEPSPDLLN